MVSNIFVCDKKVFFFHFFSARALDGRNCRRVKYHVWFAFYLTVGRRNDVIVACESFPAFSMPVFSS